MAGMRVEHDGLATLHVTNGYAQPIGCAPFLTHHHTRDVYHHPIMTVANGHDAFRLVIGAGLTAFPRARRDRKCDDEQREKLDPDIRKQDADARSQH